MNDVAISDATLRAWRGAQFVLSGARLPDLPRGAAEVAIAGRSNAGKSTALNVLTDQGSLARTSKTPGRTQLINLFALADWGHLADLPGYGFAKAPREVQRRWTELLERYFEHREELRAVVLIVDIRRGLGALDRQLLRWVGARFLPVHVLLSKADKLSRGAALAVLQATERELQQDNPLHSAQLFSATARTGVDEARARITALLQAGSPPS